MRRRIILFAAIFLLTAGFDQGSKQWARTLPVAPAECDVPADLIAGRCQGVPQTVIAGAWDWELAMNPGASFSSFAGQAGAQVILALLAALALIGIGIAAARTRADQPRKLAALALIAGGALGNLVDRVRDGAVTDFIRWRLHDHRWPVFNVADAALLVGVGLLLIDSLLAHRRPAVS